MQVRLVVTNEAGQTKRVHLNSDAVIGRSRDCKLRIASGEISRKHCKLTVMDSGVLVRDLQSANGTYLNGKIIPPDRDVALTPGSRLAIGPVQIAVYYESSNPAIEPPGSTVELPVVSANAAASATNAVEPDSESPAPTAVPESSDIAAGEKSPQAACLDEPADDGGGAVETVVVEPGIMQRAIAEGFSAGTPQTDEAAGANEAGIADEDTAAATDLDAAAQVDAENAEVNFAATPAGEVEEPAAAEDVDDNQADARPAAPKRKLTAMLGGLMRFGRKRGGEQPSESQRASTAAMTAAADEPAEVTPAAGVDRSGVPIAAEPFADEPEMEKQASAPKGYPVGPPDVSADELADEFEGEYDDEHQYDDEGEPEEGEFEEEELEEEEFDEDLGEFFQQFET